MCESSSPGCGDDLIVARYVSKTTVLWNQTDIVGSSRAGKSKILQQGHNEDKKLHPSQRLANTRPLPCEETRPSVFKGKFFLQKWNQDSKEKDGKQNTLEIFTS